jgi:hypothetical protein
MTLAVRRELPGETHRRGIGFGLPQTGNVPCFCWLSQIGDPVDAAICAARKISISSPVDFGSKAVPFVGTLLSKTIGYGGQRVCCRRRDNPNPSGTCSASIHILELN